MKHLNQIVHNAQQGAGPCNGCPAQSDTAGRFVNPGLLNPGAELMFLTMDPSHFIDWGRYKDWSEYNADKAPLFKEKWPGGRAIAKILSGISGVTLSDIWLADAVKCPVNNDRAGEVDTEAAFHHCSTYLRREIEEVKPSVIITMGNDPAEQLLNGVFDLDISSIRAGTEHCGQTYNTDPPVVISPHWANGWLGRHNNRVKVREAIRDVLEGEVDEWDHSGSHGPDTLGQGSHDNEKSNSKSSSNSFDPGHEISRDTWRGKVARVLCSDVWMDAHDVSKKLSNSPNIPDTISKGGASSVLSDMNRHDDVHRRRVSKGNIQYEYRLRDDIDLV